MIHYTCDRCRKVIDLETEARYEVRIEVQSVLDSDTVESVDDSDDRDHLLEIHDALEREFDDDHSSSSFCPSDEDQFADEADGSDCCDADGEHRYDLCSECFEHYAKNPMGRELPVQLGFSQN